MERLSSKLTTNKVKSLAICLKVAVAVEVHLRPCLDRLRPRLRRALAKNLEKIR